jgi:hypothetical protein
MAKRLQLFQEAVLLEHLVVDLLELFEAYQPTLVHLLRMMMPGALSVERLAMVFSAHQAKCMLTALRAARLSPNDRIRHWLKVVCYAISFSVIYTTRPAQRWE